LVPAHPDAPLATSVRAAIDLRRFPWIRRLVAGYTSDFASVSSLFAGNPADPGAWRQTIERVQHASQQRTALASLVSAQLERRGAPADARAAARLLADPKSVAIVTGQQAGLFGGPLYTLLKAVTAIQLARRVSAEHGVPVVPVFWVDSEDHDWEEVRAATVLDADLAPASVSLDDLEGAGTQPVAALTLDEGINDALAELESRLAPTEFTADTLAALRRRYTPGAGFATAFAGWIDDLLGPLGLVVFEAADPAAKPLVADLFAHELEHPGRTTALTNEAGARMRALGHQPQVEPAADSVALFYLDGQGRRAIKVQGASYVIGDVTCPAADLIAQARRQPERFSPNVLLRPLVQDRLFPNICYVAGPSELAYQAQLGTTYREFGVEMPLLFPRATATIVDSGAARFLDKSELAFETLHARDDSALNKLLERSLPPTLEQTIEETGKRVGEQVARIKDVVTPLDPTLAGAADTTIERVRETLKSLHGKIIQAAKRKDETLRRQFTRTRALAFPGGHPQERVISVAYFICRYGPHLPNRLLESLPLETDKHYILTL